MYVRTKHRRQGEGHKVLERSAFYGVISSTKPIPRRVKTLLIHLVSKLINSKLNLMPFFQIRMLTKITPLDSKIGIQLGLIHEAISR